MDRERINPVAEHLIRSYFATSEYSRDFNDAHGVPPTLMSKAQHLRSVMQARLVKDVDYELSPAYLDFGRVEFTEATTGNTILLKSSSTLSIAPAVRFGNRTRLHVRDEPILIGFWPFRGDDGDDGDDTQVPFDQDGRDPFGDVGSLAGSDDGEVGF